LWLQIQSFLEIDVLFVLVLVLSSFRFRAVVWTPVVVSTCRLLEFYVVCYYCLDSAVSYLHVISELFIAAVAIAPVVQVPFVFPNSFDLETFLL
jgi:hypothetical protein